MLSDASFGQYYPVKSFIHSMDSRAKLLIIILLMVIVFMAKNFFAIFCLAFFVVFAVAIARIPLRSILKSIKPIIFLITFTAILNILFFSGGNILWQWKFIKITDEALLFSARMASRLLLMFVIASLLTLTTTPVALTDAVESLRKPLRIVRFPVHEIALIMSIALRFIPILLEETDRIINAQKARGANFESGNIIRRAKALLPVLIPLLISAFNRADDLADAMDSRCYNGATGRTKMKKLRFGFRDLIAFVIVVALSVAIIIL